MAGAETGYGGCFERDLMAGIAEVHIMEPRHEGQDKS